MATPFLLTATTAYIMSGERRPLIPVTLIDDQYSVNLEEIKAPEERAILIATKPLTVNEKWKKISGLRIFKEGRELK